MNSGLKLVWTELLSIVNNPNGKGLNAEFHMHQRPCHRAAASNSNESCEMYLMRILTNPLSLKQQARIVIRNQLIENIKSNEFVRKFILTHPKYQLNSALESHSSQNANKMNGNHSQRITTTTTHQTNSILECLIWQLDLPRCLHFYLYAFPDVSPMPDTTRNITVFVND